MKHSRLGCHGALGDSASTHLDHGVEVEKRGGKAKFYCNYTITDAVLEKWKSQVIFF